MPTTEADASRIANSAAPTLADARKALATLESLTLLGYPGGLWKALDPLAVLRGYLANPSAAEISSPAPDAARAA